MNVKQVISIIVIIVVVEVSIYFVSHHKNSDKEKFCMSEIFGTCQEIKLKKEVKENRMMIDKMMNGPIGF